LDGDAHLELAFSDKGAADCLRILEEELFGENRLNAGAFTLSATTGGTVDLGLKAGALGASRNYLVVGSVTGVEPGIALPGGLAVLPVNWDDFTDFALPLANTPAFSGFLGKLDASGGAAAQLKAPNLPSSAWECSSSSPMH